MNLADRRRRKRLLLEVPEDLLWRRAKLLAHDVDDVAVREWRDCVEELEHLIAIRRRQQVEAHGEHLPELDPRAAQLLEGRPHAYRTIVAASATGKNGR